jgi:hypothetical protein
METVMKSKERGNAGFILVIILLAVLAGIGWIMNIVDITHEFVWPPTGMLVLRLVGIFVAPLGAVLGWL